MDAEIFYINGSGAKKINSEDFHFNKIEKEGVYICNIIERDRQEGISFIKQLGFENEDIFEEMQDPTDNLRFQYFGNTLYGEISYCSALKLDPFLGAAIVRENVIINLVKEDIGITRDILKALKSFESHEYLVEYTFYTQLLELMSHYGSMILEMRKRIEAFSRDVDAKHEKVSISTLLEAKNKLSDFDIVVGQLYYTLSFPPVKDLLKLDSVYRTYFTDLSKSIALLKTSLSHAEDRLNWITDHYDLLLQDRSNKRLKVLTIIQAVFVPLTLITGLYGMNFKNMPELSLEYGYYTVIGVMLVTSVVTLWYFYKNKWFD